MAKIPHPNAPAVRSPNIIASIIMMISTTNSSMMKAPNFSENYCDFFNIHSLSLADVKSIEMKKI